MSTMDGGGTHTARTESLEYVYHHLLCEFAHYDICLNGLIEVDGVRLWVEAKDLWMYGQPQPEYVVTEIPWDAECEEYLTDYTKAYPWWVRRDGKKCGDYRQEVHGPEMKRFREKWDKRNPIWDKVDAKEK